MGKRSSRRITNRPRKQASTRPAPDGVTTRPDAFPPIQLPARGGSRRGLWFGLLLVLAVWGGGIALALGYRSWGERPSTNPGAPSARAPEEGGKDLLDLLREAEGRPTGIKKWTPPEWKPASAEDRLIDSFVKRREAGDRSAFDLLGPAPAFPKEPVPPEEAQRLETDYFLRSGSVRVVAVWRGAPRPDGTQMEVPGRYTLVTRGDAQAPPLSIRRGEGVEAPGRRQVIHPDLVVDVRGGKVHPVRADLHLGPSVGAPGK